MKWLERLLSLGRVGKAPKGHSAGRFLPPASVTRAYMDLKEVDLPQGVVQTIAGEYVAVGRISGYPLHARSDDDALAFLRQLVVALNALPSSVVLMSRSAPGGLKDYALERKFRALRAEGAEAALLTAQAQHALGQMGRGLYRTSVQYLNARGKTVAEAQARLRDAGEKLAGCGVEVTPLTGRDLMLSIAAAWRPEMIQHVLLEINGADGELLATLNYAPRVAKVTTPKYVLPTSNGPALTGPSRPALAAERAKINGVPRLTTRKKVLAAPAER